MQGVMFVKSIKKINNKGFMLAETLIVSLFVMSTFSMLYVNILPLIAEYETEQKYNTVEATYNTHWARKIILDGLGEDYFTKVIDNGYLDVSDCFLYTRNNMEDWCGNYKTFDEINRIYLTTYSLEKFKNKVKSSTTDRREFKEYIDYLPTYSKNSAKVNNNNYFHVIIEYNKGNEHNYGIMEVHRK